MTSYYTIPVQVGTPQSFSINLGGTTYQLTLQYRNDSVTPSWVLDIADNSGNPIVQGIPLVTGANLLEQYSYLGFNGGLFVLNSSDPDAPPTFENLGGDCLLYFATNP